MNHLFVEAVPFLSLFLCDFSKIRIRRTNTNDSNDPHEFTRVKYSQRLSLDGLA
jgi:hypothetical protein